MSSSHEQQAQFVAARTERRALNELGFVQLGCILILLRQGCMRWVEGVS